MPLRRFPRIIGFEVPPLKAAVDVVRDAPIVGLLNLPPTRAWLDAFVLEAAITRATLGEALVSIDGTRVLFYASKSNAQARCKAVRAMVEGVSRQVLSGKLRRERDRFVRPTATPLPRRLLLVEDDLVLLDITAEVLRNDGWTVSPVPSAAAAMTMLEAGAFDIVMTDIDLESAAR